MTTPRIAGLGALLLAAGTCALGAVAPASAAPVAPPLDWQRTILTTNVQDPTDLEVAKDGSVVILERMGAVKVWRQNGTLKTAGVIPVSANTSLTENGGGLDLEEGGAHGLLLARDFAKSRRIYVRYSVRNSLDLRTGEGVFRVSTFVLRKNDTLDLRSEKKVIDTPAEWAHCCHYGGDLEWRADGTILMTVGDDTSPRDESWNPRDNRPGRAAFNAERTSQNPKDRRGKLLRFNADGSVPKDNPHVRDKRWDPYVFAMGFRSDYRMGHDQRTGVTYVGNVGPDGQAADPNRGPESFDELEVVPKKGGTNHGWPRCIADNKPYMDYDYRTGTSKGPLSCKGFTPAAMHYPYGVSTTLPQLGSGTRTHMVGPVYRGKGALAMPASFQGKLIHWDWSRSLMYATPLKANGAPDFANLTTWSIGAPNTFLAAGGATPIGGPVAPMEVAVGPDGAMYVAEYGSGYYGNTNSAISRLSCSGCTPKSKDYGGAAVDPHAGVVSGPTLPSTAAPKAATPFASSGRLTVAGSVVAGLGLLALRRRRPGTAL